MLKSNLHHIWQAQTNLAEKRKEKKTENKIKAKSFIRSYNFRNWFRFYIEREEGKNDIFCCCLWWIPVRCLWTQRIGKGIRTVLVCVPVNCPPVQFIGTRANFTKKKSKKKNNQQNRNYLTIDPGHGIKFHFSFWL